MPHAEIYNDYQNQINRHRWPAVLNALTSDPVIYQNGNYQTKLYENPSIEDHFLLSGWINSALPGQKKDNRLPFDMEYDYYPKDDSFFIDFTAYLPDNPDNTSVIRFPREANQVWSFWLTQKENLQILSSGAYMHQLGDDDGGIAYLSTLPGSNTTAITFQDELESNPNLKQKDGLNNLDYLQRCLNRISVLTAMYPEFLKFFNQNYYPDLIKQTEDRLISKPKPWSFDLLKKFRVDFDQEDTLYSWSPPHSGTEPEEFMIYNAKINLSHQLYSLIMVTRDYTHRHHTRVGNFSMALIPDNAILNNLSANDRKFSNFYHKMEEHFFSLIKTQKFNPLVDMHTMTLRGKKETDMISIVLTDLEGLYDRKVFAFLFDIKESQFERLLKKYNNNREKIFQILFSKISEANNHLNNFLRTYRG